MESRVSVWKTKASKPVAIKPVGLWWWEKPPVSQEFIGEAHGVLEHTQTHSPRDQYLKGHNPLVGSEGSDRQWGESPARGIVPSLTPPPHTAPQCNKEGSYAWQIPKAMPLTT